MANGMVMFKSRDGAVFLMHASHATQTCKGAERMLALQHKVSSSI
jgi:hypothetical protein